MTIIISNEIANTYAKGDAIIRNFRHSSGVVMMMYNSYCCRKYCFTEPNVSQEAKGSNLLLFLKSCQLYATKVFMFD